MIALDFLFVPPIFDISGSGEREEEEDAMTFASTTNPCTSSSEKSEKHNLAPWGDRPGDRSIGWRLDHSKGFNIKMGGVVVVALQGVHIPVLLAK